MHAGERANDFEMAELFVPISINMSLRPGSSQLSPWTEYCIAAAMAALC
jgi:hypothetical protein